MYQQRVASVASGPCDRRISLKTSDRVQRSPRDSRAQAHRTLPRRPTPIPRTPTRGGQRPPPTSVTVHSGVVGRTRPPYRHAAPSQHVRRAAVGSEPCDMHLVRQGVGWGESGPRSTQRGIRVPERGNPRPVRDQRARPPSGLQQQTVDGRLPRRLLYWRCTGAACRVPAEHAACPA